MRAKSELGGAVLDAEVAERDVGDDEVGEQGVVKVAVLVHGLAHATRVGEGRVSCEPVPHGAVAEIACGV